MSTQCQRPACEGAYEDMGGGELYCDTCGLAPVVSPTGMVSSPPTGIAGGGRASSRDSSSQRSSSRASARSSSRSSTSRRSVSGRLSRSLSGSSTSRSVSVRSSGSSAASSTRGRLGVGLVQVPDVPRPDPRTAVMENPEVPERKRFCSRSDCGAPVGRSRGERPGRTEGFCTKCGHPYSFVPKLTGGDIVHGQYEVVGCLAHGGLGWVYLAVDRAVSDRWVVLKGLLDTGDQDAMAAAISERRFLAEIEHANIVRIYNFVEHLDQRTGSLDGYIVMEYVGGKALKEIANERRTPAGKRDPLPVEQACAYGIEALEALGHLHSRNLLDCDFKVDNAIQTEDQLKLIDMGAVRRMDDTESAIYGTVGYQAPEVAEVGPSVASDLYTVARTLAVLTFDFQGYTNVFVDSLPDPDNIEVLRTYESFYRLLVRAADPDPAQRFASASEMAEQLTGVLREVVALQTGRPRPALSTLFGTELRVTDTVLFAEQVDDVSRLGARAAASGRGGRFGRRKGGTGPLPGIPAQGGGVVGQGGGVQGHGGGVPVAPGAVTSAVAGALPVGGQPSRPGGGRMARCGGGSADGGGDPRAGRSAERYGHRCVRRPARRYGCRCVRRSSGRRPGSGVRAPRASPRARTPHGLTRRADRPVRPLRGDRRGCQARPVRRAGHRPGAAGPPGRRERPERRVPRRADGLRARRADRGPAGGARGLAGDPAAGAAGPAGDARTGLRRRGADRPGGPAPGRLAGRLVPGHHLAGDRRPRGRGALLRRGVRRVPGEPAPKLALGICAEVLGQLDNAAEYYRLVWATDPSFVSAAFGLARVQIAAGDRAGAAHTLESVPEASIHYTAARVTAVRARLRERDPAEPLLADLTAAAVQVAALTGFGLDPVRREQLTTEVLGKALDWILSGSPGAPPPGGSAAAPPGTRKLLDAELDERGLRLGLERSYRMLARLAQRGDERIELVERANRFRPRTWV
ncbi:Serine/threonine-protein kinase PknD [Streptomyces microflavus]